MKSMKKILTLLLVAALAGAMATTAYAERPVHADAIDMEIDVPGPVDVPVGPRVGVGVEGDDLPGAIAVSGGWNFSEEAYNNLTDENRAIFESAVANSYTGTSTFEVVQKVASESVAGANYAYLCKETPAGSEAPTNWSILTVYVDLDGNATLTNVEAIDPENIKTLEEVPPIEPGGWTILQTDKGLVLSEAVANAIMLSGVSYIPAAVLATQVVSGTNYRILAYGKQVTEYTRTDLYVLDVFEGLDGTAEVTNISVFDIASYTVSEIVEPIQAEHTSIEYDRSGDGIVINTTSKSDTVAVRIDGGLAATNETEGLTLENGSVKISKELADTILKDGENHLHFVFSDGWLEVVVTVTNETPTESSTESSPEGSVVTPSTDVPKTGDTASAMAVSAMLLSSLTAALFLAMKRRKDEQ